MSAYLDDRADTPATCAVLVRRTALDAVDGFVAAFRGLYEDQAAFYKLLLRFPAFVEGEAHDRYRRHPDAFCEVLIRDGSHADDARPTAARGAFLAWLDTYVRDQSIDDPALRRRIDRARWPYRHAVLERWRARLLRVGRSAPLRPIRRVARALGILPDRRGV